MHGCVIEEWGLVPGGPTGEGVPDSGNSMCKDTEA